jgi:hypothetical protein
MNFFRDFSFPVFLHLSLAAALSLAAGSLLADNKPAMPKGDWDVGMMKDPKGQFGYCLMRAPYDNGLSLAIALSGKQEVNIGVQVPGASYSKDEKFPMVVAIDDKLKRERVAVPVEADLLLTTMGADKDVLAGIRSGKILSMKGPEDTAYFSLRGTSKGLKELQKCVDTGTGKIKPEKVSKAATKGKKLAFPQGLMQLLQQAGIKNIEVVDIPDPTKAPVDLAWRTDGVFGGLRERPVPKDATIEKMTDVISEGFKSQCEGMFAFKPTEVEALSGLKLRKADVSCQMGKETITVALLLYLTDTNLFSMFMHEGHGDKKDIAVAARDALTATIRELSKKQKEN